MIEINDLLYHILVIFADLWDRIYAYIVGSKAALQRQCDEIIEREIGEGVPDSDIVHQDMGRGHREKVKRLLTSESSGEACIMIRKLRCRGGYKASLQIHSESCRQEFEIVSQDFAFHGLQGPVSRGLVSHGTSAHCTSV